MFRSISIACLVTVSSLCIFGCHGSPPAESTPAAGDTAAKASPASTETAAATSTDTSSKTASDSTAKAEGASDKSADSAKDCPQGGCRYKCTAGQTCEEDCKGGACDMKCEKDSKCTLKGCEAGSCKLEKQGVPNGIPDERQRAV